MDMSNLNSHHIGWIFLGVGTVVMIILMKIQYDFQTYDVAQPTYVLNLLYVALIFLGLGILLISKAFRIIGRTFKRKRRY